MPSAFDGLKPVSRFAVYKFLGLAYAELKVNFVEGYSVLWANARFYAYGVSGFQWAKARFWSNSLAV